VLRLLDWRDQVSLVDTFTLNFECLEQNKNGFMCLRPQSIAVLDERVDCFVVYKALSDPRLLLESENFDAKLLSDFSGMVIKEPSIPTCFTSDVDEMEDAESQYLSGNCERVFEEHRMKLHDYLQDKSRKHRYTVIKFPYGMKGSNLYFNKTADGGRRKDNRLNLDTNPRFMHQNYSDGKEGGLSFDYVTTYCYWKVAIEGTERTTNEKKGASVDDLFAEALRGMKRTSISRK
jgi:hypothetical protein